jgi:hypothetical protein
MQPDVDWPNELDQTRAHGHGRVYWTTVRVIDRASHQHPGRRRGRLVVDVHQVVRDLEATCRLDPVRHVTLCGTACRPHGRDPHLTSERRAISCEAVEVARLLIVHHTVACDALAARRCAPAPPIADRYHRGPGRPGDGRRRARGRRLPARHAANLGHPERSTPSTDPPCLESTTGRPFGVWVHGNNDTYCALLAI